MGVESTTHYARPLSDHSSRAWKSEWLARFNSVLSPQKMAGYPPNAGLAA